MSMEDSYPRTSQARLQPDTITPLPFAHCLFSRVRRPSDTSAVIDTPTSGLGPQLTRSTCSLGPNSLSGLHTNAHLFIANLRVAMFTPVSFHGFLPQAYNNGHHLVLTLALLLFSSYSDVVLFYWFRVPLNVCCLFSLDCTTFSPVSDLPHLYPINPIAMSLCCR